MKGQQGSEEKSDFSQQLQATSWTQNNCFSSEPLSSPLLAQTLSTADFTTLDQHCMQSQEVSSKS